MNDLTIGIPTYNRCKYLDELLNSLHSELKGYTFPFEIVISDNNSIDSTRKIISKWQKNMPIVYSKNKNNLGMDANIDKIFQIAKSEYVLLISDDDIIMEGMLKHYIDLILNESPAIVYSRAKFMDHNLTNDDPFKDMSLINFTEDKTYKFNNGVEFFSFSKKFFCGLTGVMFKREDFLNSNRENFIGSIFIQGGVAMEIMSKKNAKVFVINKEIWIYRLGKISSRIKTPDEISEIGFGLLDLLLKIKRYYPLSLWLLLYMDSLNWVRGLMLGIKSREGISKKIKESYIKLLDKDRKKKPIDFAIIFFPDIIFKLPYLLYRLIKFKKWGY